VDIERLEQNIRYTFKNKELLKTALTHTSYAHEKKVESNEKLEFLGDSILEFVTSNYLYNNYKANLLERYKITESELDQIDSEDENEKLYNLMKLIGRKRGAVISGGEIDDEKTAKIILNDFRSGKLGKITLEKVNEK